MTPEKATLEDMRQAIRFAAAADKQMKVVDILTRGCCVVLHGLLGS